MADKSKGFVAIFRSLQDHWLWTKKPFGWGQAWIDLILLANHDGGKVYFGGDVKTIRRGQLKTSKTALAERWGWNRKTVDRFLNLIEEDGMITVKSVPNSGTMINIVNYNVWQAKREVDGTNKGQIRDKFGTNTGQLDTTYLDMNNNVTIKQLNNKQKILSGKPDDTASPDDLAESFVSDTGLPGQSKVDDAVEGSTKKSLQDKIPYCDIVDYLNAKTGKSFRASGKATRTRIQARWNEGFRLEDFKSVIDHKVQDWKGDEKMDKYLRPETLFGTKFEGYLNEQKAHESQEPTYSQTFADSWEAYQ